MLKNLVPVNPRRNGFFDDLNTMSLDEVERKYLDCSLKHKVLSVIKPFVFKIGVFSLYMKVKRAICPAK